MSADERFRIAGEAACLLEELGFTAVARKKDDLVTLEFWPVAPTAGAPRTGMRRVLDDDDIAAEQLASECVQHFGGKTSLH